MFEGIYFQFPKLAFVLFFFLACEALCPLRSNPLYFPHTARFGAVGVKAPLWLWIAKWAMVTFLVIALMSPVRDRQGGEEAGYDILLILDPASLRPDVVREAERFIQQRGGDRIALWIPGKEEVIVPLTHEHDVAASILAQATPDEEGSKVTRTISRFFTTSHEGRGWAIVLSDDPETFVHSLPVDIETSVVESLKETGWGEMLDRTHPPYPQFPERKQVDYFYVYPLFLAFLAMLAYLYGRNQKGVK